MCHKPIRTYDVGAPSAITISLPGMDPVDAERRRYCVQNVFRSIHRTLRPTGRRPWIILRLWRFLCVMDAGRRGNKITAVLTRISATLEYTPHSKRQKNNFNNRRSSYSSKYVISLGRGNSSAWEGEGCAWIPSFPLPPSPAPLLRPSMQNHTLFRYRHTVIDIINSVTGNQ